MRCEEFGEHLTAYSLGELSGAKEADARAHATGCRSCSTVLLGERQLVQALRRAAAPAPPAVRKRVHTVIGSPGVRWGAGGRRTGRWLALAGLLMFAAGLYGLLLRPATLLPGRAAPATVPASPASSQAPAAPAAPAEPLDAAWAAFGAARLPLGPADLLTGDLPGIPGRADLLVPLELYLTDDGVLRLAGRQATVTCYQGRGGRLAVFRWLAGAGTAGRAGAGGGEARQTSWGRAYGRWWSDGRVVSMVVGALPEQRFRAAAERVRQAEPRP